MPAVAALKAVPFPLTMPLTVVDSVMEGVVVGVATVPDSPFAVATDALVTVPPEFKGVAQIPSPRQNVVEAAPDPPLKFATGRFPVMPRAALIAEHVKLPFAAMFVA